VIPSRAETVDHTLFDAVLKKHVADGRVDYPALKTDARLEAYLARLGESDASIAEKASQEEKLAFWINVYNAATLRLVTVHYPVKSIRDIPHAGLASVWDIPTVKVGARTLTLNQIEHDILRAKLKEPRIHFAVVCAAVSCPPLRSEAYVAERLEQQLDDQARGFLARQNRFDLKTRRAELSRIFEWFAADFGADAPALLARIAPWAPESVRDGLSGKNGPWTISYQDYDWSLNVIIPKSAR
jgi:hypothetical protein